MRFWLERGVDGYRVDAIDRLMKDPELRDDPPATQPFGLPVPRTPPPRPHQLAQRAGIGRGAGGHPSRRGPRPSWWGRCTCPRTLAPYLEHLDAVFSFELLHARWEAAELGDGDRVHARPGTPRG